MILKSDSFPFNPLKSKTLVIAPLTEPFLTSDRDVRVSSEIGDSRQDHGRIGTPFMNKNIWSRDEHFSVRSDVGEADKLESAVQPVVTGFGIIGRGGPRAISRGKHHTRHDSRGNKHH